MAIANPPEVLDPDEPPPVVIVNSEGRSPFLIVGDHAGNAIPRRLGTLGLSDADRTRHIAWDIGVGGLGTLISARLDASFIHQRYSRLVVDCNRDPASREAIPEISDGTPIPGNEGLSAEARAARVNGIHRPYQDEIASILGQRAGDGRPTILIALHSFTPVMAGTERPWHAGVLYSGGDTGFARALLAELAKAPDLVVGDNEPYRMDETDHTVPRHAFPIGLPYAEIEIRQDLIGNDRGQRVWADRLSAAFSNISAAHGSS